MLQIKECYIWLLLSMFRTMKCIHVKKFVYLTIFHFQPISLIGIQVSDLRNTGHGRRNECYI